MLSRDRMDRMLSAPSFAECAKQLVDCGYEDMSSANATGIDAALSRRRAEVFAELAAWSRRRRPWTSSASNTTTITSKCWSSPPAAAGVDGEYLLSNCGRVGAESSSPP